MAGPFDHTLATGAFRMLAFDLQGRDLTGGVVRLMQGTVVRLGRIECLPGWAVLRAILPSQEAAPHFLVRDENVADISVPLNNNLPVFQPAAPVFLTAGDNVMSPPFPQTVVEDVVVCDAEGRPLAINAGDVVQIFVYNQASLAWLNTADGNTFVVDPRRPVQMALIEEPGNGSGPAPPDVAPPKISPAPQPDGPADPPSPEVEESVENRSEDPATPGAEDDEGFVPHFDSPSPQAESTPDLPHPDLPAGVPNIDVPLYEMPINFFDDEELDHAGEGPATDLEARVLAAEHKDEMAALARVEQVSPADFTQTDQDFCAHCWAFAYEHAAHCPFGRRSG